MSVRGKGPVYKLRRLEKARMIEAILADHLQGPLEGKRILDIGCGNGDISQYLGSKNTQYGVDISDRRRPENRSFTFAEVDSEVLPFEDGYFDIVLSHHVIEHVPDQMRHLSEIRRVLHPSGVAYLATPNKSSPIMQGHVGNEQVLRYSEMARMFESSGFDVREYSVELVKRPRELNGEIWQVAFLPRAFLRLLRPLFPSHVFVLSPRLSRG